MTQKKCFFILSFLTLYAIKANASVYVMCHTDSATLNKSNSYQTITASYTTHIKNTTGKIGEYDIQTRLDLDNDIIYNTIRTIVLKPGEEFFESFPYSHQAKFTKKHKYNAPCTLNVYGHEEGFIKGGGYVNVI